MEALYVPHGDGYRATELTRGPWDPGFQHAGPPSALLAREAALRAGGEVVMTLAAWRMRISEVELPDAYDVSPPPGPEGLDAMELPFWPREEVAYHRALEWRRISGVVDGPGPAAVWARLRQPLVAGEEPSPTDRLLVMADAASGISAALDWLAYGFLNVDLSIHLERPPVGEWMAMDAETRPGAHGFGQCVGRLYDTTSRIGWSAQSLLVTRR